MLDMSPAEVTAQVRSILVSVTQEADALLAQGDTKGARYALDEAKRDLRDIKRTVTDFESMIRLTATDARQSVGSKGQMVGLLAGSKARGVMAKGRASAKRNIAQNKTAALAPWIAVKSEIDQGIANLDRAKAGITAGTVVSEERPASPPPLSTPATWAPDPFRRHELRYWNGSEWTEHVANRGVQGTDPAR